MDLRYKSAHKTHNKYTNKQTNHLKTSMHDTCFLYTLKIRCTLKLVQNQMVDAGKNHNGSKINAKEMAGFDHRCWAMCVIIMEMGAMDSDFVQCCTRRCLWLWCIGASINLPLLCFWLLWKWVNTYNPKETLRGLYNCGKEETLSSHRYTPTQHWHSITFLLTYVWKGK